MVTVNPAMDITVLEAAATWYVDLQHNTDTSARAAHRKWLEADPAHRQAWIRVQKLQQILAVTPGAVTSVTLHQARSSRRQAIKTLSVMLMMGAGSMVVWQQKDSLQGVVQGLLADYRTSTGEHRGLTLPDSSQLQLNTATAVDVSYSENHREIYLHEGEIQISTAKDAQLRPFTVHTPEGSIRALGTRFLVLSENGHTRVSVLEHAVEIQLSQTINNHQLTRMEAGQQRQFSAVHILPAETMDPHSNAWTKGFLVASNWRLDHFLGELSRYRPGRLSYDSSVAALRISGAFHLNNTDAVLQNLAATLPVDVHYLTRYWVKVGSV